MKNFFQRLLKFSAYAAAGVVILLAIGVGLFRLFLPRLPQYQDEIKTWASAAIGMQVEFSGMDARWGLRGPELKFHGAELIRNDSGIRVIAAREVGVGVSLMRLLIDRTLVVDTVTVTDTSVEVRRTDEGRWLLQGLPIDDLAEFQVGGDSPVGDITIIGEDLVIQLIQPGDERPSQFQVSRILAERDAARIAIDVNLRLPESVGRQVRMAATHIFTASDNEPWHVAVETDDLLLAGLLELMPERMRRFTSGAGDVDVTMAVAGKTVLSASGNVDFQNVTQPDGVAFDVSGRIAYNHDDVGWLVAADEFALRTASGEWPASTLRVEASTDSNGEIVMVDASASYLNFSDLTIATPWLEGPAVEILQEWRPDGVVQDLAATVSDMNGDSPRYTVSAELMNVGFAATDDRPGIRGFTGNLRADHDGGLLEIDSTAAAVELPSWFSLPFDIASANGTVIWRRGDARTTVLSDSIVLQNAFFNSQSNIEIVINQDGPPDIDLVSTWSIGDIAAAKAYIPEALMKPKLFLWFQDALVAGQIPRGETRLNGPLDKFPFDGGEGKLLITSTIRDLQFRYARQFPLVNVSEMEVVLDNTRLFTNQNRSMSLGNRTVNATVEIADLRKPVLTIASNSTGSLNTIRNFAANSPIGRVFGGQLDRVTVAGDASLRLNLTLPLTDVQAYTFTSRITSSNGSLAVAGLQPPITDLSGIVRIERDLVSSEALGGQFLGEPVTIEIKNAAADLPGYRVVSSVVGTATADALAEAFELPLANHLNGSLAYRAEVLFPRAGAEPPSEFTVEVATDLVGLGIDLPPPFGKNPEARKPLSGELAFADGGAEIVTRGQSATEFAWDLRFARQQDGWDFDRGVLTLGDTPMFTADVRGLHIRGETPTASLEDWLALSRGENAEVNVADRIRSIELRAGDLYVLGQHLPDHSVRVDRSARDWLVQIDGTLASGSVFVPYDFSSDRALVLDMERLILPGNDSVERIEGEANSMDPRRLPPISIKAKEFAFGKRFIGALEAEFARTSLGLVSDAIVARDKSFDVVGTGRWVADLNDPLGSRSYVTATLTSTDVAATMKRLDYQPGIVSNDMSLLFDMNWSGGPSWNFLQSLDGEVQVRLGSGQLDEVDPGAGRMFGLMSIVALPRRLSLDFRDVFQKGFGFDTINGTFRLEDGVAYTCNLSLVGPAADIGIVGRADLVNRDYSQAAVVSANVGNTLPVVGALAAGPQAAAALFLFSQIFKKPLQDIGQVYYGVSGNWDAPLIESADAQKFAVVGDQTGCLADSE
ncbi:MAG: TIGR02099 family protein [Woeseiaceae bacterium]|nr:TIGR02099 family protein [Woeseiaceae bacterium]